MRQPPRYHLNNLDRMNPETLKSVASMATEQIQLAIRASQQGNPEAALNRLSQTSVLLDRMRALIIDNIDPLKNATP